MSKQVIPNAVATRLNDAPQYIVEQRSGFQSWVEVTETGLHMGPCGETGWYVYMNSGGKLDV